MKKQIKFVSISNHVMGGQWLPAASANIISHLIKDDYIKENYNFLDIEFQNDCLDSKKFIADLNVADMLCITNYVWNQSLNDSISNMFKIINPDGIVVYGGPNVPKFNRDIIEFVETRDYVDYFFTGAGEKTFKEFLINGTSNIKNGYYCHDTYKEFNHHDVNYNELQLSASEYPMPSYDGLYDHILNEKKYDRIGLPVETTRGCPYSCSFCDWGGQSNGKVVKFDDKSVVDEIKNVIKNDSVKYIDFCDANYGIYERDIEIIKQICLNKNKVISVSFSGVAKNGSKHVDEIYSLVKDNFSLILNETKISLQTMDANTLEINKRSNISTVKLLKQMDSLDNPVRAAELIIGLPGETGDTWAETIFNTAGIGFTSLKIHRLVLSPNILLNDPEFQLKHNIKPVEVQIPRLFLSTNHIGHLEEKGIDTETFKINDGIFEKFNTIASCDSFDVEEIVKMHHVTLWYKLFIESKFLLPAIGTISPDTLRYNYELFKDNINNMNFINSIFQEALSSIRNTFSKDKITLNSLKDSNYFLYIISSEKYHIVKNFDKVKKELQLIYPDESFDYLDKIQKKLLDDNDKSWKVYKLKSPYALKQ